MLLERFCEGKDITDKEVGDLKTYMEKTNSPINKRLVKRFLDNL